MLSKFGLLKGKTLGVDSTTLEANAAPLWRSPTIHLEPVEPVGSGEWCHPNNGFRTSDTLKRFLQGIA